VIAALAALALAAPATQPVERWQRPWLVAKAIADVPYGAGAGLEVFVSNDWAVGADVNFSPVGIFYRASLHYWLPLKAGRRHHQFMLGLGGDFSATFGPIPGGGAFVIIPGSLDLRYVGRPIEAFGFVIGLRSGVGVAVPTPHFALSIVTYAGFVFGARR
jgi:hypothetical protein